MVWSSRPPCSGPGPNIPNKLKSHILLKLYNCLSVFSSLSFSTFRDQFGLGQRRGLPGFPRLAMVRGWMLVVNFWD